MFKKKKPKYKTVSEDDPWLTKTWNDPKGRNYIQLALFGLVMLILIVLVVSNKKNIVREYETTYVHNSPSLSETLNNFFKQEYTYEYIITINEVKTIYRGEKTQTEDTGYKETSAGITKYKIKDSKTYVVDLNEEEIETNNLYDGINSDYLNIEYLLSFINEETPVVDEYYMVSLGNNETLKVKVSDAKVSSIILQATNYKYELNFQYK